MYDCKQCKNYKSEICSTCYQWDYEKGERYTNFELKKLKLRAIYKVIFSFEQNEIFLTHNDEKEFIDIANSIEKCNFNKTVILPSYVINTKKLTCIKYLRNEKLVCFKRNNENTIIGVESENDN